MTEQRSGELPPKPKSAFLDRPLVVAIITIVVFGGLAKLFTNYQDAIKDQYARRAELNKLLTEYQHRMHDITAADAELGFYFPPRSVKVPNSDKISTSKNAKEKYERIATAVGKRELSVISGRGSYIPTRPEYAGVNLQDIGSDVDRVSGLPDYMFGSLRMLGLLDVEPSVAWLFIHSELPMMNKFGTSRSIFYALGVLPLVSGQSLNRKQEGILGIPPELTPEQQAKMRKHVDELAARVAAS